MEGLNSEQQEAIKAVASGHVAVIAGPGTGKTHTLVSSAVHLLQQDVTAEQILVLTFTHKAADELGARLKKNWSGRMPQATTFHAWAYQQIKKNLGNKKLIDIFTQRSSLIELKKQTGSKYSVRELGLIISRAKNGADQTAKSRALLKAYDELLIRDNLIDFDDLLHLYLESEHKTAYKHVLVDEFQDTSPLQYSLLERFAEDGGKLFVIGDPNQSIYGFRGAGGEVFEQFLNDYKPSQIILTHNYRSTRSIVEAASAIFPKTKQEAVSDQAGSVKVIETLDIFSEADYIIRTIEHALGGTEWAAVHHDERAVAAEHFRDFAVLYRNNHQGKRLVEKLRSAGLPVQVTGEDSPYATPLAQAVLAVFVYLKNPGDEAKNQIVQAVRILRSQATLAWLEDLDATQSPAVIATTILQYLGYGEPPPEFQPLLNNLAHQPDLNTTAKYWLRLIEQDFYDPQADCITLSTIHASKGLEFRHVFVAGCNEGLLPHEKGDISEEKRLFYVAMTRAIESLTLIYCQQMDHKPAEASQFLSALPASATHEIDDQLTMIQKRRARSRQKRAQQSLF